MFPVPTGDDHHRARFRDAEMIGNRLPRLAIGGPDANVSHVWCGQFGAVVRFAARLTYTKHPVGMATILARCDPFKIRNVVVRFVAVFVVGLLSAGRFSIKVSQHEPTETIVGSLVTTCGQPYHSVPVRNDRGRHGATRVPSRAWRASSHVSEVRNVIVGIVDHWSPLFDHRLSISRHVSASLGIFHA